MNDLELIAKYKIQQECISKATACEENRRKFRIHTDTVKSETFLRIKVDNCFIKSEKTDKCDFVFHRCATNDFYYVELKGSDYEKAYKQICKTLDEHIKTEKNQRFAFIVASRVPKGGTDVNKLKNEFRKKYGQQLFIKNNVLIFDPQKAEAQ